MYIYISIFNFWMAKVQENIGKYREIFLALEIHIKIFKDKIQFSLQYTLI